MEKEEQEIKHTSAAKKAPLTNKIPWSSIPVRDWYQFKPGNFSMFGDHNSGTRAEGNIGDYGKYILSKAVALPIWKGANEVIFKKK